MNYIADSLYCLQHHLAVKQRFVELISPTSSPRESGEEVMNRMKKELGR